MLKYINQAIGTYREQGLRTLLQVGGRTLLMTPIRIFRKLHYRIAVRLRNLRYSIRFGDAAPGQYDLLHVNPANIEYYAKSITGLSSWGTYIVDGDWDTTIEQENWYDISGGPNPKPFEEYVFYQSVKAHFEQGVPWEETDWLNWVIENQGGGSHYSDRESTWQSLHRLEKLYSHMQEQGYKSQAELLNVEDELAFPARRKPCPEHYEIKIMIGRDGTLLCLDGRHRVTVAKLLDITKIPVRVTVRHAHWQEIRTKIAQASSIDELDDIQQYMDHPDLQELSSFKDSD